MNIPVYSTCICSPISDNHSLTIFCHPLKTVSETCMMTKSSAYRTNLALTYTGHLFAMARSRHSSALLVTNGEITPPCGVPSSEGKSSSPSIIPALSHPLIARLIWPLTLSFISSFLWSMLHATFRDIRVQHILRLSADTFKNGGGSVMSASPWTKAIAIWLKISFPFGF